MERVTQRDLRALLECLREVYALQDVDAFAPHVIAALPKVVPAEITSYNEVNPRQQRIRWLWEPSDADDPSVGPLFERHIHEHPLITRYQETRDGCAFKMSDFLTPSQFHRLGLYNEFYRRFDVEYQMAFALPTPPPLIIGIALNRGRRDFTERDRLLLNLLRPHLVQAYRNAEAVTQLQQELAAVRQALEALERGVIVLGRAGRVRLMTPQARRWVAAYFGSRPQGGDRLPEDLRRWVRHQEGLLAGPGDLPPPRQPLLVERDGKRLVVRLLTEPGQSLLLLEEQQNALTPLDLERVGLTRREGEVLCWVAEGKTDGEIGAILGLSVRTVQKHLEHIFTKLGVETRTAAVAWMHRFGWQEG